MNAWNVRSAMSANKTFFGIVFAIAALLAPVRAQAQVSAPGMFGVKEIVVQYVHFANPKASDACGLTREDIASLLDKILTDSNVPAISVADAKPPMMGVARIELVPEISSINNETLDCTSWVSLTAQSQNNVTVPPIDTQRNVTVGYWHKGTLVASGQSTHSHVVDELLKKMAVDFAQRYRLDQPPALPDSTK